MRAWVQMTKADGEVIEHTSRNGQWIIRPEQTVMFEPGDVLVTEVRDDEAAAEFWHAYGAAIAVQALKRRAERA